MLFVQIKEAAVIFEQFMRIHILTYCSVNNKYMFIFI